MEHESLSPLFHHLVDDLLIAASGAKGGDPQTLGLPAGEQG